MPLDERRIWLGLSLPAWLGVFVGLSLLAGLLYFLINLGPRKVSILPSPTAMNGDQSGLSQKIDEIEQRYLNLPPALMPPIAMEEELTQAMVWQEQLLRSNPAAETVQGSRLNRLLVARDTVRARRQWDRVEALEAYLNRGMPDTESSMELEELLRIRRKINQSRARARYKDLVRQTQLERRVQALQAEPLRAKVDEVMVQAKAAADQKDWPLALDLYARARAAMDDINQRFSRTRHADINLGSRLKSEEVALQGAAEAAEIDVYVKGGDAVATERPEVAAEYYRQAIELQHRLNSQWPRSRFFSTSRLDQLTEKQQTVQSGELIKKMQQEDTVVRKMLGERRLLVAERKMVMIQGLAKQLTENYPRSRLSDDGLSRKYTFLATLRGRIRGLQDEVYDQLLPLPNDSALMLMRGEVTQGLYSRIMKFNPSRIPGEALAVESLTWDETQEFCQRLNWILGRPVRLPACDEVLRALGNARAPNPKNSEAMPADPVGNLPSTTDYVDLTSNVAEWLLTGDAATEAWVVVGKGGPKPAGSSTDLFVQQAKETRSRGIGFRVIVEIDGL